MGWLNILMQQITEKGPRQVAREIGMSSSTLSLVCAGKYTASTAKIEKRVSRIYGAGGKVQCPVLDAIEPEKCADAWNKAKKIGMMASNPDKLKLYYKCLNCSIRNI